MPALKEAVKDKLQRQRNPRKLTFKGRQAPLRIEREYQRDIKEMLRKINEETQRSLIARLPKLAQQFQLNRPETIRQDAIEDDVNEIIGSIRGQIEEEFSNEKIDLLVNSKAKKTSEFNRKIQTQGFRQAVGIDILFSEPYLADQMGLFSFLNSKLVKDLREESLKKIEDITFRGFAGGLRHEEIAKQINMEINPLASDGKKRGGKMFRRAEVIARDQINKLNGQLSQLRQTELGVKGYIWRTSGDERVREEHRRNNGKFFSWDKPPKTGHPGEDIQCRCTAEPVLDTILS